MQAESLNCPTGQFSLVRPGSPEKMPLRAWDAADEYLIEHVSEQFPNVPLTILNDGFGALACALNQQISAWHTDSYCAKQALALNTERNDLSALTQVCSSTDPLSNDTRCVVMKIPKNTSYLTYQLQEIQQLAISEQRTINVILAGMMKHLPKTLLDTLGKFGAVNRLPFKKKAMLLRLEISPSEAHQPPAKYPKQHSFFKTSILGHANVFGRDKLDQGTELLLANMPSIEGHHLAADLCCGTGILGLNHAKAHPDCQIDFYDESYMAVDCAQQGIGLNNLTNPSNACWDDGMKHAQENQYDLILCNPPFHEQHAVGDHIAWRLFNDAKRSLKAGGKLIIVGNRHLGYHTKLKRLFGNSQSVASNSKFVVLQSIKK